MGAENDLRPAAREPACPAREVTQPRRAPSAATPIVVAAKLAVGASDDPLEREADRVAAQVITTLRRAARLDPRTEFDGADTSSGNRIRRMVLPVEPAGPPAVRAATRIRRRTYAPGVATRGGELDAGTESRIRRASGGGRPLDPVILSTMGPAFGADFSAVRVHADDEAGQLNRQIKARAFTSGNDIFFGSGEYQPASDDGQRLLAHELTHVVQRQTASIRRHDEHNDKRLEAERAKETSKDKTDKNKRFANKQESIAGMRMDHTVSDQNLRILAKELLEVRNFALGAKEEYTSVADGWKAVEKAIKALPEAADYTGWDKDVSVLGGLLANLRMNLVPGLIGAAGNPGSGFDPIVETIDDVTQTTVESDAFLELDNAARSLPRLTRHLPKISGRKGPTVNDDLDAALGKSLKTIAAKLGTGKSEPKFSGDVWDVTLAGHAVKKPAGERYSERPDELQSEDLPAPDVDEETFKWTIDVVVHGDNGVGSRTVKVAVEATISEDVWAHIYERHTLEYFKGRVRPTNTFWKRDPPDVITKELLEPEVNLQIDRKFDLAQLIAWKDDDMAVLTGTANTVFVQGKANFDGSAKTLTVKFDMESVAPQHDSLGWSISPTDLKAWSVER